MKMWHVVIIAVIAYLIGTKWPAFGTSALGKVGL